MATAAPTAVVEPALRWRPQDAGLLSLRRAARAALLMPVLFAVALFGVRSVQLTTFVAFGTFALVVLANFGGSLAGRAGAYAVTALVGAVLIVAGTLAGSVPWVAALAMLVVAFGIQFAGVFGGYAAASQVALLLAFVLAVSVPAPPAAIPGRLEGWLLASVAAMVTALVLWPQHERQVLRERAAAACRMLADLVESRADDADAVRDREEAAANAVGTVRAEYDATPLRPAGPTRHERAFAQLVVELDRALAYAARWAREPPGSDPRIDQEDVLERAVARTLRDSATALDGDGDRAPDLAALDRAKTAQREALERWAATALVQGGRAADVLDGLRASYRLRILSYVVLALGADAAIATGRSPGDGVHLPQGTPRHTGLRGGLLRVARTVRTDLTPGSSVLHNCLRGAAGLALTVLLTRLLGLDHGFWAVLGALSVLRSNALATGRTTLEALAGTLIGFAVGAAFMVLVGSHAVALWVALPVAVFLAAYAPTAVHFVVGQAAFTILVIVLFNLIAPAGWQVGLVRVEDIALGTGVSVVASLLLWPRGARAELRRALADQYRGVAAFLAASLDRLLHNGPDVPAARAAAERARDRAGEAFDQLLTERRAHPLGFEVPASLVAAGSGAIVVGDLLAALAAHGYGAAACAEETAAVGRQAAAMLGAFQALADRLDGRQTKPVERVSAEALHEAVAACLRSWAAGPTADRTALTLTYCAELVEQLDGIAADLEAPVEAAVRAARVPWWR